MENISNEEVQVFVSELVSINSADKMQELINRRSVHFVLALYNMLASYEEITFELIKKRHIATLHDQLNENFNSSKHDITTSVVGFKNTIAQILIRKFL